MLKRLYLIVLLLSAAAATALFAAGAANAQSNPATTSDSASPCSSCHSNQSLTMTLPEGDKISLFVDETAFARSVHSNLGCPACHQAYSQEHAPVKATDETEYRAAAASVCRNCHPGQELAMESSVHTNITGTRTANCLDCHEAMTFRPRRRQR